MEMSPEQVAEQFNCTVGEWDIFNVKKEVTLLPPTTNVPVKILEIKQINKTKEGDELAWKMLVVKFQLTEGIDVGGERKFKGSILESNLLCYNASESKYDFSKPFYSKQQFLVEFASLCKAIDLRCPIGKTGATEESMAEWIPEATGQRLTISVLQQPVEIKDPETGKYVAKVPTELKNIAANFKKLPESSSI